MDQIKKILKFAMRMEKDAENFYTYYMDKVKSEDLKKLFNELAEMESGHYNLLKQKYDELSFSEPPLTISWVVDDNFAAKDPHILADNSDIMKESENGTSDLMVIRMAYLIENDFAEFYKHAIEIVDNIDAKGFLKTLSKWETSHKEFFYNMYQDILKKHWEDISSIIFT